MSVNQRKLQAIQDAREKIWGFKSFLPPNLMDLLSSGFWQFFSRWNPPVVNPLINPPAVPTSSSHKLQQGSWFMATSPAAMVGREGLGVFAYLDEDSLNYNKSIPVIARQPLAIQNKG